MKKQYIVIPAVLCLLLLLPACGRAEEDAFINGRGEGMPTGILHGADGAEVGLTTAEISQDKLTKLQKCYIYINNMENKFFHLFP